MKIFNHIKTILEQNERFCKDGKLFKNAVIEAGLKLDPALLSILLSDKIAKKYFFTQVKNITVFDKVKFQKFVSNKQFLPDSYTAFKNKIGLTANGEYLTEANEVVLDFPYKDCVLEGGQTKEDQKRQEVFWNETLAPDEIDRLFEPKVLTNWKRYDKDGEHKVKSVSLDDNFIIKGNNLLALHSLKKVYRGKVKLIYIDPPYNTGNDSFGYNDKFNHITWLTFMKNRLEVARELLRNDGVIFVQCDDNEQAYLKVLMDGVFGRDNFVVNNVYKRRKTQANLTKNIAPIHEHIICFSKSIHCLNIYNLPLRDEYIKKMYRNPDNDPRGLWRLAPLLQPDNSKNKKIELIMPNGRKIKGKWRCSRSTFEEYIRDNLLYITDDGSPNKKIFLSENKGQIPNSWLENIASTEEASKEIDLLFGTNSAFSYSKPEGLIKYILKISTQPNDIVLDYHLGSGTTCAVAHKMGRQYIGIEQMDYIEAITCKRLKKVIGGEQNGISKTVNWKGGGNFIYAELAKDNITYLDKIQNAKDSEILVELWNKIKDKSFISYKVDSEDIDKNIIEFQQLSLDDQKQLLISLLDKNQLYVNYSEMKNKDHNINSSDRIINRNFYNL